jgi:hypothetical protein
MRQVHALACDVVFAINGLNAGTLSHGLCGGFAQDLIIAAAQHAALNGIVQDAAVLFRARRGLGSTGASAVKELTKAETVDRYHVRFKGHTQVPLMADLLDEPSHETVVDMLSALPPDLGDFYRWEHQVVAMADKSEVIMRELEQRYGFVGGSEAQYVRYFHRKNLPKSMWTWIPFCDAKGVAGMSAVLKKNGLDQRKLLMAVSTNYAWIDVASRSDLGLVGAAALCSLHTTSSSLEVAALDESAAFTSVATPEWFWPWFTTPPLRAGLVRSLLPESLQGVADDFLVSPAYRRLPMGSSHAVHILMAINLASIGRTMLATRRRGLESHGVDAQDETPTDDATTGDPLEDWLRTSAEHKCGLTRCWTVLHLFSGRRRDGDLEQFCNLEARKAGAKLLFLSADTLLDPCFDLTRPRVFARLYQLAAAGFFDVIVAGPPCSTFSRARHRSADGPRPVRSRGLFEWGLPHLSTGERASVANANVLLCNSLSLMETVCISGGCYILEHPMDPGLGFPSIWDMQVVRAFELRVRGQRASFHQCMFGGRSTKATTLSSNAVTVKALHNVWCDGTHVHHSSWGRQADGAHVTAALATYPPALCQALSSAVARIFLDRVGVRSAASLPVLPSRPDVKKTTCFSREDASGNMSVAVLNESCPQGRRVMLDESQGATYLHVDDGLFITPPRAGVRAKDLMESAATDLEALGFRVPDRRSGETLDKIVGYSIQVNPLRFTVPPHKLALLHESLSFLIACRRVHTGLLRSILGSWLFAALLRRETLSCLQHIYTFLERFEDQWTIMWPSVRRELVVMRSLLPLLWYAPNYPISGTVVATDAMTSPERSAFGIVAADVSVSRARKILQSAKRLGHSLARDDDLRLSNTGQRLVPTTPFTLIADDLFDDSTTWLPILKGKYMTHDHIMYGEGRAVVKAVDLVARTGARELFMSSLQDNNAVSGSFTKGRSSNAGLNFLCRKFASVVLAARLWVLLPWVQSALQPADYLSRE